MSRFILGAMLALVAAMQLGCSSTPGDPLEKINRPIYWLNDKLDRYAMKPAADAYVKVVPLPIRQGIGNGLSNFTYLNVILNDFLQGNVKQGLSDTGRMAVNSTIGVAGIFDVATEWGMPKHENRLGTTLGKWGVPAGPYLVLPVLGPYTLADTPGIAMAWVTEPLYWLKPGCEVTVPLASVAAVDARSRLETIDRFRRQTALDPYVFTRDAYLQYRNQQISGEMARPRQDIYDEDLDERPATRSAEGE